VLRASIKVPLLKYEDSNTGIDVDLSVNNILAMYNSDLIYTHCQIDQRFHIMSTFLKHWAKQVGIIGAPNGYLSSYALIMMLIAFLQSKSVLPCLQERKLRSQTPRTVYYPVPIEELESKKRRRAYYSGATGFGGNPESKVYCMIETDAFFESNLQVINDNYMTKVTNTSPVGQLLYEFFVFYFYEFEPTRQIISIKEPTGFTRKCQSDKLPFSIVDPFDVHKNPGRTVKASSTQHKQIMMQFKAALDRFVK